MKNFENGFYSFEERKFGSKIASTDLISYLGSVSVTMADRSYERYFQETDIIVVA